MKNLEIESWIWYGFAVFVAVARLVSRALLFGSPLRLKFDDYLAMFAIATYTTLVVCMNIVADTSSNLIPPGEDVATFSKQDIKERVYGSKLVVVVEQMQCATIWTLKATLLIMYFRVTKQLPQHLYVKLLMVYVGVTFVVMEILYFAVWCHPFHDYWAVPTPNKQCDTAIDHLITNAVFNLTSDVAMLIIGFSLAAKSKLPWKRRILMHGIFALGIFVIVAAVLNKYYSFSNPYGSLWTFWYIREASTAMIVANLPYTWTLIRRVFNVGSFTGESDSEIRYHSSRTSRSRRKAKKPNTATNRASTNNSGSDSVLDKKDGKYSPSSEEGVEVLKPAAKRMTWRDRGVFCREDAELFAEEAEDEVDLEAQEARRRCSSAVVGSPGQSADANMVLNDVGSLGTTLPTVPSPTLQHPSSPTHNRHRSGGSSGRQSPEMKRMSRSGAPEYFGRPPSIQSKISGQQSSVRPLSDPGKLAGNVNGTRSSP